MKNILVVGLVAIIVFALTRMITPYSGMHMMHNFYYYNNVVIYGLALVVVVIGVTYIASTYKNSSSPMKILDQRLAEGEISIEEYQKIRDYIQRGNKK